MRRARTALLASAGGLGLAILAGPRVARAVTCGTDTVWCVDNAGGGAAYTTSPVGLSGYGLANLYAGVGTNVVALTEAAPATAIFSGKGASFGATISTQVTPIWWNVASSSLYFAANDQYVYSLDATTGACNWRTYVGRTPSARTAAQLVDPAPCTGTDVVPPCGDSVTGALAVNVGASSAASLIYVPTNDGAVTGSCPAGENRVYALNAATGVPTWTFNAPADFTATSGGNTVNTIKNGVYPDVYPDANCAPAVTRNHVVFADSAGVAYILDANAGTLLNAGAPSFLTSPAGVFEPQFSGGSCGAAYVADNGTGGAGQGNIRSVSIDPSGCPGGLLTNTPCTIAETFPYGSYTAPIQFSVARGGNSVLADRFLINDGNGALNVWSSTAKCFYKPATGQKTTGLPFEIGGVAYTATTEGSVVGIPLGATQVTSAATACNGYQERFFSAATSSVASNPGIDLAGSNYQIFAGDQAGRMANIAGPFSSPYTVVAQLRGYPPSIGPLAFNDGLDTVAAMTNGILPMATTLATGATYSVMSSTAIGGLTCTATPNGGTQTINNQDGYASLACAPTSCALRSRFNFPVGGNGPLFVAVGDLNGDGKPDLVTANATPPGGTVSVLLNLGAGVFGSPTTYPVGSQPFAVAIGDLDGDGRPDLAVANGGASTISVLLGSGTGTFGTQTTFAAGGAAPVSIVAADFNGDGKSDLAVANSGGATVGVLLNTGAGTFGAASTYTAGSNAEAVAAGDFNGDGSLDLAVAVAATAGSVGILLNSGTGTFGAVSSYAAGKNPSAVVVGDFNGDGKPDVAVSNGQDATVSVLLNSGTGTLGTQVAYAVGTDPFFVAAGDLDGDGRLDLTTSSWNTNTADVLLNLGAGTFGAASTTATGAQPRGMAVADLNGDGSLDLAVTNQGVGDYTVSVHYETGTCTESGEWLFNEGSGSIAHDTTGNGDDGAVASATWATAANCHSGTCLSFTPPSSVTIPYTAALKFGTGPFTASAWIKTTSASVQVVVGPNRCSVSESWNIYMAAGGKAAFATYGGGGATVTSPAAVNDGKWHLLTGRRYGLVQDLLVDGAVVATGAVTAGCSSDGGGTLVTIGNLFGCTGLEFNGSVDSVQIYGRALSNAQVRANAAALQVSLSSAFTTDGIIVDGIGNPTHGLNGNGASFSASLLNVASAWKSGTVGSANGVQFNMVFPAASDIANAVWCTGQTLTLPAGSFSKLSFLAVDAGVVTTGQTGTFTVTYTDATTSVLTNQNISDALTNSAYVGETVAATTAHLDSVTGAPFSAATAFLYEYSIALNPAKTVASITLPNPGTPNKGINVLAITLTP